MKKYMKNLKEYIVEGIFDIDNNIDKFDESIKDQIKRFLEDNFDGASSCKISDKPNADGKYEVSSSKGIIVKNKIGRCCRWTAKSIGNW